MLDTLALHRGWALTATHRGAVEEAETDGGGVEGEDSKVE